MTRLLLAATAATLLAGTASAQAPAPPARPEASRQITLEQFKSMQAERAQRLFARFDADKDGRITAAEMQANALARADAQRPADQPRRGGFLMRLDADKDGAITVAEMQGSAEQRFQAADANKDGVLSGDELAQMRQHRGHGRAGRRAA